MNVTYEHPTTPTQQKRKQLLHCWTRSAGLASEACWEHSSILLQATQSPTWWHRPDLHSTTGKLFENRQVSSVQGKKKITAIFTWFQMVAKHAFHVQFLGNVSYWEWLQMRRDGPQHRLEWRSRTAAQNLSSLTNEVEYKLQNIYSNIIHIEQVHPSL